MRCPLWQDLDDAQRQRIRAAFIADKLDDILAEAEDDIEVDFNAEWREYRDAELEKLAGHWPSEEELTPVGAED